MGFSVLQCLSKPGPTHLGKDRIRRDFKVHIRIDVGDNPRLSLPRVLPGRIVKYNEATTGNDVVAEFHIYRLGEPEGRKPSRCGCFADAELWAVLQAS